MRGFWEERSVAHASVVLILDAKLVMRSVQEVTFAAQL